MQTGELLATMLILGIGWLVLAIWLLVVSLSIRKINKRGKIIAKAGDSPDFVGVVESSLREMSLLSDGLKDVRASYESLTAAMSTTIQRIGVVRFDAFDDIGGKLSFAVALLSDRGDGVVLSTINGRHEGRSYAKAVAGGQSEYSLSAEEQQAIMQALSPGITSPLA